MQHTMRVLASVRTVLPCTACLLPTQQMTHHLHMAYRPWTQQTDAPERQRTPSEGFLRFLQDLRRSIVPSAAAYKLDRLMAAVATYQQRTRQRVWHGEQNSPKPGNAEDPPTLQACRRNPSVLCLLATHRSLFAEERKAALVCHISSARCCGGDGRCCQD